MQIKKEEMEKSILQSAEREFLIRGFKDASMRTIATKAHTSLGNLYNYFPSKSSIFTAVIGDTLDKTKAFIQAHYDMHDSLEKTENLLSIGNVDELITLYPELFPFDLFLSKPFIIFIDEKRCKGTPFYEERIKLIKYFSTHISEHLSLLDDPFLSETITEGFIQVLIKINQANMSREEEIDHLTTFIKCQSLGIAKDIL